MTTVLGMWVDLPSGGPYRELLCTEREPLGIPRRFGYGFSISIIMGTDSDVCLKKNGRSKTKL